MPKTEVRRQFPDLMTTKQVAVQLGVNVQRVRQLWLQKRLVARMCGKALLFEPESVYAFTPKAHGRPRKNR